MARPLPFSRPGTYSSSTAWKFVPPNPKALTAATRGAPLGGSHSRSSVLTANGVAAQSMFGLGSIEVEAGRQHLVMQGQRRLQQSRPACGALQVADVRLHRAECDGSRRQPRPRERLGEALDLDHVADRGRGPVALYQPAGLGREAGIGPGALDRQPLPNRVGGGDPLPLAVARPRDTTHHGVDPVAGALGVVEPLQHEHRRALAHHETVGAVRVGPRAGRGERPDGAELDERRRPHVAIDAAGDHGVELAVVQALDRGVHRRHGGRAGRVDDKVRAAEIEEVGDPAGEAVAELAGHCVLGDRRQPAVEVVLQLAGDRIPGIPGEARVAGRPRQLPRELGEGES